MVTQTVPKTKRTQRTWREVLVLKAEEQGRSTVWRYYRQWRQEHGLPERCDNVNCHFHTAPLKWNDKPLIAILDHSNGNRFDNKPNNLRFLCPNCDSQQVETRGGANRGRVIEVVKGGASLRERDGTISVSREGVSRGSSYAVAVGKAINTASGKDVA
jgi:hypothetical protein